MAGGETQQLIDDPGHLRVLIANEIPERLEVVAQVVSSLGHDVIAREMDVNDVVELTRAERPDVALVGLGESSERALDMITKIVREAACPVIAVLHGEDPSFVNEAAKRGVFAYIADSEAKELQSAIDIVLRRFAEYHNLEGAFLRRAMLERAKGILMAIHGIEEREAFEMLRAHSQHNGRKLPDLAAGVVESHRLLVRRQSAPPLGSS